MRFIKATAVVGGVALVMSGLVVLLAAGPTLAGANAQDPADAQSESDRGDENETVKTVTGTLENPSGDDYQLNGVAIDIGPEWYTSNTTADTDFDDDGVTETISSEFDGLVGEEVTMTVETDGEEGDVRAVNGDQYREEGPPPWAGGPGGNGPPDHAGPN